MNGLLIPGRPDPALSPIFLPPAGQDNTTDQNDAVTVQPEDSPKKYLNFGGTVATNVTTTIYTPGGGYDFVITAAVMTVGYAAANAINSQFADIKEGSAIQASAVVSSGNAIDLAAGKSILIKSGNALKLAVGTLSGASVDYAIAGYLVIPDAGAPPPATSQTIVREIG